MIWIIKTTLSIAFSLFMFYVVLAAISHVTGAEYRVCVLSPNSSILKLCYQSRMDATIESRIPYMKFINMADMIDERGGKHSEY